MIKKLVALCDESLTDRSDLRFNDFFGATIIAEDALGNAELRLENAVAPSFKWREHKWNNMSQESKESYMGLMEAFFDLAVQEVIKLRILYIDRNFNPERGSKEKYFKLYYQLVKNGFGLRYMPQEPTILKLLLDQIPRDRVDKAKFRAFISGIPGRIGFNEQKLRIPLNEIREVSSADFRILQALDVLIGSLGFRLNRIYQATKLPNGRYSKTGRAKLDLYEEVISPRLRNLGICNIGINSLGRERAELRWSTPASIWVMKRRG